MARRKRPKRRRSRKGKYRFWVYLVFLAAFIALIAYGLSLPVWEIREVVVNGARMLSPDEVRDLAGVPLAENLFYTSLARSRANLKKISAIREAKFYRIPPGTILINVTERSPVAYISFAKRSVIVDGEGYILNQNPNLTLNIANRVELPVISGISEKAVLESRGRINQRVAQVVSEVIVKLSRFLELRKMQLELGGLENISFLLDDLLRVKLGSIDQLERKMEVFKGLLPVIAGKWSRVAYVDIRFPDTPVIRYR
ncbi:cell division protein FtsQ/DivIB [Candidatus Margulisiibacteriota bacterium]